MTSMSKKEFLKLAIENDLFAKCKKSKAPWKSVIEKVSFHFVENNQRNMWFEVVSSAKNVNRTCENVTISSQNNQKSG